MWVLKFLDVKTMKTHRLTFYMWSFISTCEWPHVGTTWHQLKSTCKSFDFYLWKQWKPTGRLLTCGHLSLHVSAHMWGPHDMNWNPHVGLSISTCENNETICWRSSSTARAQRPAASPISNDAIDGPCSWGAYGMKYTILTERKTTGTYIRIRDYHMVSDIRPSLWYDLVITLTHSLQW